MALSRKIWVTFARKGIHAYAHAPSEVAYLAHTHRHLFKYKVSIEVQHNDREIEFHMFQTWLESMYEEGIMDVNHKSCEMLAEELLTQIVAKYPGRKVAVEVSEDGECGAVLEWEKEYVEREEV